MNIPVGKMMEQNMELSKLNLSETLKGLIAQDFSGYIIITIEGAAGMEEAMLLFREGSINGSVYEYLKFNKQVFGNEAMPRFFNAAAASVGVVDIAELSRQQSELIVAFNEKIEMQQKPEMEKITRMLPKQYSSKYAEQDLAEQLKRKETRYEIFKRLGLGQISR